MFTGMHRFIWSLVLPGIAFQLAHATPPPPTGLNAIAGDQSIILHWNRNTNAYVYGYRLYRSVSSSSGPFSLLAGLLSSPGYCDMSSGVINGQTNYYYATILDTNGVESSASTNVVAALPHAFASDDEFLDYVQQANFDYFWYWANPLNGLIPDRSTTTSPCSIAAEGFGLTAIGIGIDHGWISRADGAAFVNTALNTFYLLPQGPTTNEIIGYKGWFYHFLDMNTGLRTWSSELSSIDTCLFLAGVLYVKQYFNGTNATETAIRSTADAIFNRVDWNFMSQGTAGVAMGWQPTTGFSGYGNWTGYNEGMIIYCMGLGTSTSPLPPAAWGVWTSGYTWQTLFGQSYVTIGPLFCYEYSHCWIDFRFQVDAYLNNRGITYFENSRRAALAQVAYCATTPFTGYSSTFWGLTACDGPSPTGYTARGLPAAGYASDDGTIAPCAAGGAICFAPEYCLPTLKAIYTSYRTKLWTESGFHDAFNIAKNYWDTDELGIDQGPIVVMIENYRTQRVWRLFMQNPEIPRGLQHAGFVPLSGVVATLHAVPAQKAFNLSWSATNGHGYQVEYAPDLRSSWSVSPGLAMATNSGLLNWLDAGPPATATPPATTPTRFYRVFQVGP